MIEQEYKDFLIIKRQEVLTALSPYFELFNIEGDYIVDNETQNEWLVLNGQKIGCTGNSIKATYQEFIAYIFVKHYCRFRSLGAFEKQTLNYIKQYWRD